MTKHHYFGIYILVVAFSVGFLIADTFIRYELKNSNGHLIISDSDKGLIKVKTDKNGLAAISIDTQPQQPLVYHFNSKISDGLVKLGHV